MGVLLRLLIIGLILWLLLRALQRLFGFRLSVQRESARAEPTPPPAAGQVMRRCAYCRVHTPEAESLFSQGHYFCSGAHRDAFFQKPT